MKSKLEQYVENIVRHTECSKQEKEDLYEELLIHLELSRDQLIEDGLTLAEAEEKAMQLFGNEGEIGSQIQQSLFPYRKELMLTLAVSSILFTITVYLINLFVDGDAQIGWLTMSMAIGAMLLFLPLNQFFHLNKKLWLNSLLIIHALAELYGWLIVSGLDHPATVGMVIWDWLNIALTIGLVYRTTIYDYSPNENFMKILHGLNITSGIIISGITLFFLVGMLIMIGEFHPRMLIFMSPLAVWIGLYIFQLKIVNKSRKMAFLLGLVPLIIIVLLFLWIYYPQLAYR